MQKPITRVLNKDNIKLPYLKRSKFVDLMKVGLGYERGTFYIKDFNRAEEIKTILSEILEKDIIFPQTCLICETEFQCLNCKYYLMCSSRDLPFHCICPICSKKSDVYNQYIEKNRQVTP